MLSVGGEEMLVRLVNVGSEGRGGRTTLEPSDLRIFSSDNLRPGMFPALLRSRPKQTRQRILDASDGVDFTFRLEVGRAVETQDR